MDEKIQDRIDRLVEQVADLWMTEIGGLPPMSLALRIREDFDSHTHDLAEKIRATGRNDVCAGVDCCQPHGGAADLIDPAVTK